MATASKLAVDSSATALDMASTMFGSGIKIVSAEMHGATAASGTYSGGDEAASELTPADTGVILSTGKASDVTNSKGDVNSSSGTSTNHGLAGNSDLGDISGQETFDAALFEAEFVPEGSTLSMQVVFSSEEYLEYVDSGFNDAVGIWVNGEPAALTVGTGDISIDNINDESNQNLYIDNPKSADAFNTEMDGFTVTLTLKAPVNPGEVNTIEIGIADGGDGYYDSNLLIAGGSVQTALVAGDDDIEMSTGSSEEFDLLANDSSSAGGTLTITEINGQPVAAGDTVVLATGEAITLTETGLVLASSDGTPDTQTFSYTVADEDGNTDVAFVTMTTVAPCFTAGTLIDTPQGPVPVEQLAPGDRVITLDDGPQPVRWVGQTERVAQDADAPIRFSAGALGAHDRLELSPNHRVLVASPRAELMFGTHEVLVKARHMVNGGSIRRRADGAPVRYVHLLMDRHQVICGNGLWSESYHPGLLTADGFDPGTEAELLRLFPELAENRQPDYGPTARMDLKRHEALLLLA